MDADFCRPPALTRRGVGDEVILQRSAPVSGALRQRISDRIYGLTAFVPPAGTNFSDTPLMQ